MSGWRNITVDGKQYVWRVGRNSIIARERLSGKKLGRSSLLRLYDFMVAFSGFMGSYHDWEHDIYKGNAHFVSLDCVAQWIRESFK